MKRQLLYHFVVKIDPYDPQVVFAITRTIRTGLVRSRGPPCPDRLASGWDATTTTTFFLSDEHVFFSHTKIR